MSKLLFIIGAGRSGTTWLQLMLSGHPNIATGQESQLFNNYMSGMVKQWENELNYPKSDKFRFHGISAYLKENEFYGLIRQFADGVFHKALAEKPTATYFLEKSPNNSFHLDTILKCYPEAKFIHLIRDGRDVASSILAAKTSWGKYWSHQNAEDAALDWKSSVTGSFKAKSLPNQYLEVRYESLLDQGEQELKKIFEFIDIDITDAEIHHIYESHLFEKLKNNKYDKNTFINPGETVASGTASRPEPENFFRKGISGDWKNSLSKKQLEEFYWVAGDLLVSLGYDTSDVIPKEKPFSIKLREIKSKLRSMVGKVIRKLT